MAIDAKSKCVVQYIVNIQCKHTWTEKSESKALLENTASDENLLSIKKIKKKKVLYALF